MPDELTARTRPKATASTISVQERFVVVSINANGFKRFVVIQNWYSIFVVGDGFQEKIPLITCGCTELEPVNMADGAGGTGSFAQPAHRSKMRMRYFTCRKAKVAIGESSRVSDALFEMPDSS